MIRNEAQRVREPAAMLLLAAMGLSVFVGIWTLFSARSQLIDVVTAGGLNFGDRALEAFGHFAAIYVTALPVTAVVLATLAGEKVTRARQLTQAAVALQSVALVLGVVSLLAAFGSHLSTTGQAQSFFIDLAGLAVAVAGLMFTTSVLRSADLRPPVTGTATATLQIKPVPHGQPGYGQHAGHAATGQQSPAQAQAAYGQHPQARAAYGQQPYPQGYSQPARPAQQPPAQPAQPAYPQQAQPQQAQPEQAQPQQAQPQPAYPQQAQPEQAQPQQTQTAYNQQAYAPPGYGQQSYGQQAYDQPGQQAYDQPGQQPYAQPGQQPYAQTGY
ncbi:MAG TPA: hypothetical protein VGS62_03800, partial [Streptosporangiaceae bacterium]|nr:hypothetical protein [Streptosporangiaceae bacterium]